MQHICAACNFSTDNGKVFSNHIRWYHTHVKGSENYQKFITKLSEKHSGKSKYIIEEIERICPECNTKYKTISKTNKETGEITYQHKFCCKTCANKQGSKYVDYSKVSTWAKENPRGYVTQEWRDEQEQSDKCIWRSKREKEIVTYFKETYKDDEWMHGCIYKKLCPDLWSRKLKIVIEYDGIWHFKDIHGQLERKHRVDCEILKYCQENGYRLIRIDEELNISLEEIVKAVYHQSNMLELFGSNRYGYLN